ncbi:21 kDa subunit of NADH dehydrogenase [Aaosphaeria arxii CBS 175.79]|uniref:21 kDa subunit of NADH dehydrogenase n=1 Tax=Aaosphaeria arxii CBS 175.79 TaxID=1450172 RepID=A0A6A5XZ97_9PLEO|nr:21 kDa subunit of NADH dehydrogenase [Aaosphaeria arxii CBS 175.79]KAF2018031.1 21 kDa subunit of NADH dehydrogenase [Aaosphaeria arxii CBS 175.79]
MASKKVSTNFAKYTVQPTGIYGLINRIFALDSKRSSGVPLNPQFRNPPPGALDPATYDDPVTLPAADIAENPYWKRDVRRRYPQLSTVTQADAVALLEVGSEAQPKQELIGEAGSKQLVAAQEAGVKGLAVAFEKNTGLAKDVLGPGGLPPLPSGLHIESAAGVKRYNLEPEQSYENAYVHAQFYPQCVTDLS